MIFINVFLFEFKHFINYKSKTLTYLIFVFACIYSLYNGFHLHQKHQNTIISIKQEQNQIISQVIDWFDNGNNGPKDKSWISIKDPYWSLNYIPTYVVKKPSPLLPLGLGQAEQYGFYKKITNWSSTYDNDMVEEISNPERLINGNIDFSFLIIFLLPVILIIFTYNIRGLEQDLKFEKLIAIQFGSIKKWVLLRFMFYVFLLTLTVIFCVFCVSLMNNALSTHSEQVLNLMLLSTIYILFFSSIFYLILINSYGSSAIAFKMISMWLLLCVIIPGSVHQYASIKYPVNYMTDYLDVNRKEAYELFELSSDSLYYTLIEIYPDLYQTKHGMADFISNNILGNTVSAIINQMNKRVISEIENQNEKKNQLISSTYWYNPISFFQNKWNAYTFTDYYSYKGYRDEVQHAIDNRARLLVYECWNEQRVDKLVYQKYLETLNTTLN